RQGTPRRSDGSAALSAPQAKPNRRGTQLMALGAVIRRNQPRFGAERSGLLQQARLAGPMPWVIAIMVTLTVMAAAAGLALSNVAGNARSAISGGLTVQVVEAAPAERDRQA